MSPRRPQLFDRRAVLAGTAGLALPPALALGQEAPTPEAVLQARRDPFARLAATVTVEGRGPYQFVIDTGASGSVISDRLAADLGLAPGPSTLVHGLAGAEARPTVLVGRMAAGRLPLPVKRLSVLRASDLDCDGLLGLDAFSNRRVSFDFTRRTVSILRPGFSGLGGGMPARPTAPDQAVIRARRRFGQLMIVDARAAGRRVTCFIDSGAEMSVGNLALLAAIRARPGGHGRTDLPTALVRGATGDDIVCQVAWVDALRVGEINFSRFLMGFADLHTFDLWALKQQPAVMIGMDFLNLFSRVEVDFSENQIRFQGPATKGR